MPTMPVFPLGTPILIENPAFADDQAIMGRIIAHQLLSMDVLLPPGNNLAAGTSLRVHAQMPDGLYSFDTQLSAEKPVVDQHIRLVSPSEMSIKQRRAQARLHIRLVAQLTLQDGQVLGPIDSRTLDIGPGGVGLVVPQPVSGTVSVRITVPRTGVLGRGDDFHAEGEVKRCAAHGETSFQVGIAFTQLAPRDAQFLADYLRRKMHLMRDAGA